MSLEHQALVFRESLQETHQSAIETQIFESPTDIANVLAFWEARQHKKKQDKVGFIEGTGKILFSLLDDPHVSYEAFLKLVVGARDIPASEKTFC